MKSSPDGTRIYSDQSDYLQVLNLVTGAVRRVPMPTDSSNVAPVAASADDRDILTLDRRGDLLRLIAIPRAGGPPRELMPFAQNVNGLDVGPNGDIFVESVCAALVNPCSVG